MTVPSWDREAAIKALQPEPVDGLATLRAMGLLDTDNQPTERAKNWGTDSASEKRPEEATPANPSATLLK